MKQRMIYRFASVIGLITSQVSFAQTLPGKVDSSYLPQLKMHYQQEYAYDRPVHPEAWDREKAGMHAGFGNTDKSYFRSEVPLANDSHVFKTVAWRGERVNAQVLVWSSDTLQQVRVKPGDLISANGRIIKKEGCKINLVRYVLANYPYGAKNAVCGNTPYTDGFLMPDRFELFNRFDLPARTVRPIWLSIDIPASTEPGKYEGLINVSCVGATLDLKVEVQVQGQTLPTPEHWQYRLDLWQNPWVVASDNHVQPWSAEHLALLKKHLRLYAEAGGKFITTYGVHSPWADNSYATEGGMIDWIRKKDGTWKFNYSVFDAYVQLAMDQGINKAITIYTAVPWGDRVLIKEEATDNYRYENWAPGSEAYRTHWNIFLTDLRRHLKSKGWFDKTYIGINESEMSQTLAAIAVIKQHGKDWKITYAGNWHPELDSLLDDYSFLYGNEPNESRILDRRARGATSTFYVCCNPPKPNNFVFSPPIEGRWISWYAAAMGYNGFLRWAYDAWPEDPDRDARFGSWPSGDCFMVYPGGNSCIRFETLREGIVDFEKINILRRVVQRSADPGVKELWARFIAEINPIKSEHEFNEETLNRQVIAGRLILNELSDKISDGQQAPKHPK